MQSSMTTRCETERIQKTTLDGDVERLAAGLRPTDAGTRKAMSSVSEALRSLKTGEIESLR